MAKVAQKLESRPLIASPLGTQTIGYTYGNIGLGQMPDQIYKVSWNGQEKVNYTYDSLGRLTDKSVIVGGGVPDAPRLDTRYTYVNVGDSKTTMLVNSVQTAAGTFTYTYDEVGNIKTVSDGTYTTSYVYDNLNQLVRENNQQIGKTYTYAYQNGNITERKEYAYTTGELGEVLDTKTWSYGNNTWSDLLTNFNGQTITYDEIGNPLIIGSQTLSWNGRQLQGITDGEKTYSYAYNIDGQRVSKTVNGVTTEFFYNGSILAGQKTGDDTLVFMYDNNGDAFGFTYNGVEYYYAKNNQNDVVAVFDANGKLIGRYIYDAWGNCALRSTGTIVGGTIAFQGFAVLEANPIRYRSYYYDSETRLYYLNSRYYSPDMCRFLNADGIIGANQDIHAYNLFAYCSNNPANFCDPTGEGFLAAIGAALGAIAPYIPWILAFAAVIVVGTGLLTIVNAPTINDGITTGIGNAVETVNDAIDNAKERAREKTKAKEGTTAIPKDKKPKKPVVFPVNPLEFNPIGLIPVQREGTKNGSFISWMDPITNKEIFRWDENPNYENGPHYHVMGYDRHFYAGDRVPDEYAFLFPGE